MVPLMGKMESRCLKWTTLVSLLTYGFSEFTCPKSAEYGFSAQTTCVYAGPIDVTFTSPKDGSVGSCIEGKCSNFNKPRYNVTFLNATQSIFEIKNISIQDEGTWTCAADQDYTCSLVITKTPTCHITSGNDTNNLDIHENISLSVKVTDYYCSTSFDFLLRVGNTEEVLIKSTVKEMNITSDVLNSTFNVTESHIGSLELIFICNNVNKTVHCGGVQSLKKRPPMCNITADRDAGGLNVGDKITMTVYIEDYSCSGDLDFFLLPGGDTNRLNVTGLYNETITFTVKESHFGPVYLEMNCNDVSRIFTCNGIQKLSKEQHTTTSTPLLNSTPSHCDERNGRHMIPIAAGIVAGVVFTIAISILIWYLVMLRRKSSEKSSGLKDVPYADVSDNVNTRPKSIRFDGAYAEVTDTNGTFSIKGYDKDSKPEIQMVPNPGYESVDDVREELSQSRNSKVQNTDNSDVYSKVNKNRVSSASVDGFC